MSRVTLRLPEDLHRGLRTASQRDGVSLNQLIVDALRASLARSPDAAEVENPLIEQVRQIRSALGEIAIPLETSLLPPHLQPRDDLPTADMLRRSMPELVPPLSATITADHEDRL
jgi:hypothetical protein